jgi:hypothetical protein
MGVVRINQLPSSLSITPDDVLVMVDNPDGTSVTKKILWKDVDAPSGGITYGRRDNQWVDITSPANLQVRRGTASEVSGIIPLQGEPVWDTTNKILYMGDESTYGGIPVSYPTKSYKFTNLPGSSSFPWFTVNLSPQNSVWEINLFATFNSSSEGNSTATFSFANSTNIQQAVGNLVYIDPSTSSTQHKSLNTAFNSSVVCDVNSDGEILRMTGAFTISAPTGTLILTEENDTSQTVSAQIAYMTLKRII